jgi:hypothetical protein
MVLQEMTTEKNKTKSEEKNPSTMADLYNLICHLSPDQRDDVIQMIHELNPPSKNIHRSLTFSWAGGLIEFQEQFTSIELEKKASEWRMK